MDEKLVEKYRRILDDKESDENTMQSFLEEHTELIPLPILENHNLHLNAVISKLKLGNEAVTDFAYLTKSSNLWRVVLVELENQHTKVFKETRNRVEVTAGFTKGLDQIHSWQTYVEGNKESLLKQLETLRCPKNMSRNPTYIEYVLIIGRNSELSEQRSWYLANLMEREHIKIMSYDSLVSRYSHFDTNNEKIVLAPWKSQGYSIKRLPTREIYTDLFAYLSPDYLKVGKKEKERLIAEGYQMDEWEQGFSLCENNKQAEDPVSHRTCRFQ